MRDFFGRVDGPRPDKSEEAKEFYELRPTPKYEDGATAQMTFEGFTARRYDPYGHWVVFAYEHGPIPAELASGVFTDFSEIKRAVQRYLDKPNT